METDMKINFSDFYFIHIGKCGGTSIRESFTENYGREPNHIHLKLPEFDESRKYIIWIRNPIKRFVSAFNFAHSIVNFDTSNKQEYTLDNCPAPFHINNKIKNNNIAFADTPYYSELIIFFKTPNNLAESLTSDDKEIKNKALKLMTAPVEHIYKGIGWYLDNGNFVEKYNDNIMFVGTLENMEHDINALNKKLDTELVVHKSRVNKFGSYPRELSTKAIKNIIEFYSGDYKALKALKEKDWITQKTLDSYYLY